MEKRVKMTDLVKSVKNSVFLIYVILTVFIGVERSFQGENIHYLGYIAGKG